MYEVLLHYTLIIETMLSYFPMNTFHVTGCDVYTYGVDCKRCGNCSGGVQCDHVTGTCPNGCEPGMYGDECDRGNFRIKFSLNQKLRMYVSFRYLFVVFLISLFGCR